MKKPKKPSRERQFLARLDAAIEWHRPHDNDSHGIARVVMVALEEVRDAFAVAYGLPRAKE